MEDLIKDGDISANMTMRPGDILLIPESFFLVFRFFLAHRAPIIFKTGELSLLFPCLTALGSACLYGDLTANK